MRSKLLMDLEAVLDYVQDQKELEDFLAHLENDVTLTPGELAALRTEDEDDPTWVKVCSDPGQHHAYAVAWRVRQAFWG
jgi:hypothetical protein